MSSAGDEARKRILRKKKIEAAMEAAFDDDISTFRKIIEEVKDGIDVPIDPAPNKDASVKVDSFLGEAACGDAVEVVAYCLAKGADPNWVGQNNRTPLLRAILGGRTQVLKPLLEAGADMRLLFPQPRDAEDNIQFREWDPADLNGLDADSDVIEVLKSWDFNRTLQILSAAQGAKSSADAAKAEADKLQAANFKSATLNLKEAYDATLAEYKAAVSLREERIKEYDRAKCEGRLQVLDVAEGLIKQAEAKVEETKSKLSGLEVKLKASEAKERQHQVAMQGGIRYDIEVTIAQLEDVLIADVGGHMASKGKKVPLAIDPTSNGLTFLTYRNVLLVDIANSHHMHPKQIKLNVLGCLRFGKPLLINLRDKPLEEALATLKARCEAANSNLYQWLVVDKSIKDPRQYEQLIDDEVEADNAELNRKRFTPVFTEKFVVALISQQSLPDEVAMAPFYSILVTS